jgi:hypothetical protein
MKRSKQNMIDIKFTKGLIKMLLDKKEERSPLDLIQEYFIQSTILKNLQDHPDWDYLDASIPKYKIK